MHLAGSLPLATLLLAALAAACRSAAAARLVLLLLLRILVLAHHLRLHNRCHRRSGGLLLRCRGGCRAVAAGAAGLRNRGRVRGKQAVVNIGCRAALLPEALLPARNASASGLD